VVSVATHPVSLCETPLSFEERGKLRFIGAGVSWICWVCGFWASVATHPVSLCETPLSFEERGKLRFIGAGVS